MIVDLKNIQSFSQFKVDVCIVGGGAAGIAIALDMDGSGFNVLLVESGDLKYNQETQDLYKAENVSFKDFPLESTRLRYFGGTTNHWGGMCRPLDSYDFVGHDSKKNWPFSKSNLDPFYEKAQKVCELGEYIYDSYTAEVDLSADFPFNDKDGSFKPVFFQRSPPTRFGQVYLDQLRRSMNIQVLLNANVQELVEDQDNNFISYASVISLSGIKARVKAKRFILAAGGLENPRILLLSRQRSRKGIGNTHDLVGRYYMDHIGVYLGKTLFRKPVDTRTIFFNEKKLKTHS